MKKIIILVVLALIYLICSTRVISYKAPGFEDLPEKVAIGAPITEEALLEKAVYYADKYHVSRETMVRKTKCESPIVEKDGVRYYDSEDPQSRLKYTEGQIKRNPDWGKVGDRENSWGPAQIHLPAHPDITKEEASDPDFALNFMAEHLSKGQDKWSCK